MFVSLLPDMLAYLDPGTGSFILQMLVAGLVGALFVIKTFWFKIVSRVKKLFGRGEGAPEDD